MHRNGYAQIPRWDKTPSQVLFPSALLFSFATIDRTREAGVAIRKTSGTYEALPSLPREKEICKVIAIPIAYRLRRLRYPVSALSTTPQTIRSLFDLNSRDRDERGGHSFFLPCFSQREKFFDWLRAKPGIQTCETFAALALSRSFPSDRLLDSTRGSDGV